eukprot:jgi/Ulvmu1/2941/UM149_0020.1
MMSQVGQYTVIHHIGSGNFGSAYMVKHTVTGNAYCLKKISINAQNQESVMKEARLLAQLASHELQSVNVIRYQESFIDHDYLCIVMELCDGDLETQLKKRKRSQSFYSEDEIMEIFVQVLMGLAHIHNNRILHRDLKAQNIFLSKGGIVKLGDLGIAKLLETTLEQCKSVVGTPYYMAPEVCSSSPYTSQADMWSLGCVLYELCTLEHAFSADSLYALIFRIVNGSFDQIDHTQYSSSLSSLVTALLDKDPARRPTCRSLLKSEFIQMHIEKIMSKTAAGQLKRSNRRGARTAGADPRQQDQPAPRPQQDAGAPLAHAQATPATPKEQLIARKLAEADRRMREVTLQIHTNVHDTSRARARKQHMLQGSMHSPAAPGSDWQQRSSSCHGSMQETATDFEQHVHSTNPQTGRAKSTPGILCVVHQDRWNERGCDEEEAKSIGQVARRCNDGVVPRHSAAASLDDRLACTGTSGYRISTYDEEEGWAQENAEILARSTMRTPQGNAWDRPNMVNSDCACTTIEQPHGRLSTLVIPSRGSAATASTSSASPGITPGCENLQLRFGLDTTERWHLTPDAGGGKPPPLPAPPLGSPVVRFGCGPTGVEGFTFVPPVTPAGTASDGCASLDRARAGAACNHHALPTARAADVQVTNSTDYSEDYSDGYESVASSSSDGTANGNTTNSVRHGADALLESLCRAQESRAIVDEGAEIITEDEPIRSLIMTLQASGMKEMCSAALGQFFHTAYKHCRTRYVQDGVNMQQVHHELLGLVDLPLATKRGAVQQLEQLVYQELHKQ